MILNHVVRAGLDFKPCCQICSEQIGRSGLDPINHVGSGPNSNEVLFNSPPSGPGEGGSPILALQDIGIEPGIRVQNIGKTGTTITHTLRVP